MNSLEVQIDWVPSHVGISGNEAADVAVTTGMTLGTPDSTPPAKAEIYTVIKNAINQKWQGTDKKMSKLHVQYTVPTDVWM